MSHQVLARKWRPQTFADIVGQEHVVTALVNALEADRLHHAYLFSGTRGVGKTTVARVLAKAFTCEKGITSSPCGECDTCRAITEGRFVDLIEVDAASRTKVEDTRELLENIQYAPTNGRFKIYLIDEVHMLSGHSFNALLKTLEEPPEHVKFLLATTDPQKLPITVLSRCLQFTLRHISVEKIAQQLQHIIEVEKLTAEPAALMQIADAADGSMRDALSMLDQAIAYSGGDLSSQSINVMLGTVPSEQVESLVHAICDFDATSAVEIIHKLAELNVDFKKLAEQLTTIFHAAALYQAVPDYLQHVNLFKSTIESVSQKVAAQDLQLFYQIALNCQKDLYLATDARAGFEMAVLRMIMFRPAERADAPRARRVASKPASVEARVEPRNEASPVNEATQVNEPAPAPQPVAVANVENRDDRWLELIEKMQLSGVALALAKHCELRKQDEHAIHLLLSAEHESLLVESGVKTITAALQSLFNDQLSVQVEVSKEYIDSPAQRDKEAQDQKMLNAQESLEQDSFVQALQSQLQAEVIPGSVQPKSVQSKEE